MALAPPPYLNSLQNNIRARPIPWDGAVRAGNLTEEQLKRIKSVDKVRKEQRKQVIEKDPTVYRELFIGGDENPSVLEKAAKRIDILQYILVLATDLIAGKHLFALRGADADCLDAPSLSTALLQVSNPYKQFLPLLNNSTNPEDPIPLLAATFLANLISFSITSASKSQDRDEEALPMVFSYVSKLVKQQDTGLQDIGVQHLSALLRSKKAKQLLWKQKRETLDPLFEILRKAAGSIKDSDSTMFGSGSSIRSADTRFAGGVGLQLMYHVLLVVWQLSFEADWVGKGLEEEYEVIQLYTQLLRMSPKEKTTRLLLSTLNNLMSTNSSFLIGSATTARLPALIANLKGRHLADQDLLEDLNNVDTILQEYTKNQTTFDEYADEVASGHLRWSPPHKNSTFWRENARKVLEHNKGEIPKKLSDILSKNWESDKKVLAIAANDIGNLVKEAPEQRGTLEKLGMKARIMELMNDPDESVRWESLKAVGEWMRYTFER